MERGKQMAEQYSVQAILSLVDKGFDSGLAKAQKGLTNLNGTTSKVINSVGKGIAIATGVGVAALTAFGVSALNSAGNAQAMEAQFEQVFDGLNDEAKASLKSVSKSVGALPNRLKPAMNQIASFAKVAGMDTSQSLAFSERALTAAADTSAYYDKSLEETTGLLQSYLKGNFQVADSLGILSTETTRNNKATEMFGASYKDLSGLQQQEVLLAMYEEANKLSGAMGQASREADGLENVLGNFKQAGKEAAIAFGTPFLDPFIKLTKKATDVIMAFVPKIEVMFKALSKTKAGQALVKMFDGIMKGADKLIEKINGISEDSFAGFDDLLKNLGSVIGAFGLLSGALPVLSKMAKGADVVDAAFKGMPEVIGRMKESVISDFKLLNRDFKKITKGMSGKLAPVTKAVSAGFDKIRLKGVSMSESLTAKFPKMTKAFSFFGNSMTKSAKVATKSMTGVSKMGVNAVGATANSIGQLAMMGLKLVGPLAGVGLALAGAGLAMTYFGDEINAGLDTAINQGPEIITKFTQGIIEKLPGLMDTGTQMIAKLGDAIAVNLPVIVEQALAIITTLVQGVMDNMPQLIQTGIQIITSLASAIISAVPQLVLLGMQAILSFAQGIFDNFDMITTSGSDLISQLITAIDTYLPQIIETGIAIITTLIEGLSENLPTLLAMGLEMITGLLNAIVENLPTLVEGTVQIVTAIANGIIENIGPLLETGAELLGQVLEAIIEAIPTLASAGLEIITAIATSLTENFPQISEAVTSGFETVTETFNTIFETLKTTWDTFWSGLSESGIGEAWETIKTTVGEGLQGAKDKIDEITSQIKESWDSFWAGLGTAVSEMWTGLEETIGKIGEGIAGAWETAKGWFTGAEEDTAAATEATETAKATISTNAEQSATTVGEMATQVGQSLDDTDLAIMTFLDNIASAMLSGVQVMVTNFTSGMQQLPIISQGITRQVLAVFNNLRAQLVTSGSYAGQGFAMGLESQRGSIISTAQSIADSVVTTINKALDEHSPSRVLFQSGAFATEGLELGMASRIGKVIKVAKAVAMAAIPKIEMAKTGIKSFVSNLKDGMQFDPATLRSSLAKSTQGIKTQLATSSNIKFDAPMSAMENGVKELISAVREGSVVLLDGREVGRSTSRYTSQALAEEGNGERRWKFRP